MHKTKEYGRALDDHAESIRLDPQDPYSYGRRAYIWATCPDPKYRDGKKALQSATTACELSTWDDPVELFALAASYAETGEFAAAIVWITRVNELARDENAKAFGRYVLRLFQDNKPYRDPNP